MGRVWRDGLPAFAAVVVLLAAIFAEAWIASTGRPLYYVETVFNAILVGIAVLGAVLIGLPTRRQNDRHLISVLSNLLVTILAFPMNIAVFGHRINWGAPLTGLWGGHIGWLFCAILQLLFLSGFGEQLMRWVQNLLAFVARFWTAIIDFIRTHDRSIIAIMIVSTSLWIAFWASKIHHAGTGEVLADVDTLVKSLLIWIFCVLIGAVIYSMPQIIRDVRAGLGFLRPQQILFAVLIVISLAVLSIALPFLLKAAGLVVIVLIAPLCVAAFIIGSAVWRVRRHRRVESQGERPAHTINPWDLAIVLLAFFVIPLIVLNTATALSPQGQEVLERGQVDIISCLDYFTACCNVASAVMQLLV